MEHASTDSSSGYDSGKNEQVPIKGFKKEDIKPFVWMKQGKEELPAKPAVMIPESLETPDKEKTKISKGKAKTNEGQELEKVREIISQHINIMMDSLTTEGKSKFKHMLDDEKISNAATEVVTMALRSTKDTIDVNSDLYDFYKVCMASFRN